MSETVKQLPLPNYSTQSKRAGLITDDATDRIRQTFEHAISVVNNELGVPLVGETEQVAYGNSVQAFAQLCRLMQVRKPQVPGKEREFLN